MSKKEPTVHLSVLLPESERDALTAFCLFNKPRLSMIAVAREAIRQVVAGKVHIDRQKLADESRIGARGHAPPPAPEKKKGKGK